MSVICGMPNTNSVSEVDSTPVKPCVLNTPQPMTKHNYHTLKYMQFEANDLANILTYFLLFRNATGLSTRLSRFWNSILNSYHDIANKSFVQLESYAVEDFISSCWNFLPLRVIPHLEHARVRRNAGKGM